MSSAAYGFTATLPPDQAMIISTAIDVVRDEPERRQRLWDNQRYFVKRMADLNYKLVATETPIVPIWLGDDAKTEKLALAIRAEGHSRRRHQVSRPCRSTPRGFASK